MIPTGGAGSGQNHSVDQSVVNIQNQENLIPSAQKQMAKNAKMEALDLLTKNLQSKGAANKGNRSS